MKRLWVDEYRPKTVDGYVWRDPQQAKQVKEWIATGTLPHLLLSGSPGTGKTTLARILINEIGIDPMDVLIENVSNNTGVDYMRKILSFAETMPYGKFKVVLLEEADYLSLNAQGAMRNPMEDYGDNCRFILTCNYPNKIIPAIHSRCQSFHIDKVDLTQFTERVAQILLTENITFDLDTLDTYVTAAYPDLRKCINSLQQNSSGGTLSPPSQSDSGTADYQLRMVELFKEGKILEARRLVCANVRVDEIEDFFKWMYNNLHLWSKTPEGQDKAIVIIRNGLVTHGMIADPEMNLSATLVELTTID